MRLDAAVALGAGLSRKESRLATEKGRVSVNGQTVKTGSFSVAEGAVVCLDGEALDLREHVYLMLNKPLGAVCTTDDVPESVLKLLPPRYARRVFCVGRLDKESSGLLFLTDDGAFDHRLMSPKTHCTKEYEVVLARSLTTEQKQAVENGMTLKNGETTLPCEIESTGERTCRIFLKQGKYHQVRRMFAAAGNFVEELRRVRIGAVRLDEALLPGRFRELTEEEKSLL